MAILRSLTSAAAAPRASLPAATAARRRFLHSTPAVKMPYKDDQDRESLKPRASENTKSGTDGDLADNPDAAFNPDKTSPEAAHAAAAAGRDTSDPLEASGANQSINKPRGDEKSSADRGLGEEVRKGGASKAKSAQKKGTPPGA